MLLISAALCSGQQVSEGGSHPTPKAISAETSSTPSEDALAEEKILELANRSRLEAGVAELHRDVKLDKAARAHAQLMVDRQQLSHHFDGEAALLPRLLNSGLQADRVGENVAYNASAEKAFEALMQSPPHRKNLLDPTFNCAGFAAYWSNGRLYVVQDFAHRLAVVTPTSLK